MPRGGEEHFINLSYEDKLIGYVRLRIDSGDTATVRELKVFGRMAQIGKEGEDWQHRGFGKELISEAERIAADKGCKQTNKDQKRIINFATEITDTNHAGECAHQDLSFRTDIPKLHFEGRRHGKRKQQQDRKVTQQTHYLKLCTKRAFEHIAVYFDGICAECDRCQQTDHYKSN